MKLLILRRNDAQVQNNRPQERIRLSQWPAKPEVGVECTNKARRIAALPTNQPYDEQSKVLQIFRKGKVSLKS